MLYRVARGERGDYVVTLIENNYISVSHVFPGRLKYFDVTVKCLFVACITLNQINVTVTTNNYI